jgi:outer membrane protein OmpA-like peptidoglycan-associated protein
MIIKVNEIPGGRNMRKTIAALSIITLCAATPALAEPASRAENIGVGSGALIGAAAGGPIGFVIGAAIGAKIGDKIHQKNVAIGSLSASLDSSEGEVLALQSEVDTLNGNLDSLSAQLAHIRSIDRPALVNLMQAGIAMDLLFRTEEYALADTTGARLAELAGSVAAMPDIRVQLDGFADERGDSDYNLELSRKRVEFVRDQLVAAGIEPSRIRVAAHGEAPAQDDSADSYALERRVSMKLFIDDSPSFASTP